MSMDAEIKIELLRALYSSFGEFLAWTQLHESIDAPLFPSPFSVIPWMRDFIRVIEYDLAGSLSEDEVQIFAELHLTVCCQRYRFIRALLDYIFHM